MTNQKAIMRDRARRERSQKFISSNFNVILKAPEIESATTIASYISYEYEPSTVEINEAFLRSGKVVLLPRINGDQLEWVRWDGDPALCPHGDRGGDICLQPYSSTLFIYQILR